MWGRKLPEEKADQRARVARRRGRRQASPGAPRRRPPASHTPATTAEQPTQQPLGQLPSPLRQPRRGRVASRDPQTPRAIPFALRLSPRAHRKWLLPLFFRFRPPQRHWRPEESGPSRKERVEAAASWRRSHAPEGKSPRQCLKEGNCKALKYSFFECKRSMLDARSRFRGRKGY
uniref:Cytochrome c oxidase assembly factor 5 n=1 Tax=Bos taurus TaxID=9913 RepID=A0AAF6Z111_BOVIN